MLIQHFTSQGPTNLASILNPNLLTIPAENLAAMGENTAPRTKTQEEICGSLQTTCNNWLGYWQTHRDRNQLSSLTFPGPATEIGIS